MTLETVRNAQTMAMTRVPAVAADAAVIGLV